MWEAVALVNFYFSVSRFDDCVKGGESSVVDAYPLIEELRQMYPRYFDILSRVPYTAHIEHDSLDGLLVTSDIIENNIIIGASLCCYILFVRDVCMYYHIEPRVSSITK